ncbi:hypothetical protein [Synechococcus sp. PCC 6312]|uniref:hypothetical protein n=1 Tax=Synechococcus sp. (strain ATCC 27167 / PCC 6312) TaxID=195253 RepID=UPI00029EDB26|nr:hypothetical protein [Synechococcus sp. PCC 6312]AFY61860.1 hypothetical protein Syn6312_2780 [Synechococcus sp. PCC 6312]
MTIFHVYLYQLPATDLALALLLRACRLQNKTALDKLVASFCHSFGIPYFTDWLINEGMVHLSETEKEWLWSIMRELHPPTP